MPDLVAELRKPLSESQAAGCWAGPDRLVWEGWVDASAKPEGADDGSLVFRLDVYVGERDTFGIGFSDNVIFRKQYYVQALPGARGVPGEPVSLFLHTGERYLVPGVTEEEVNAAAGQPGGEVRRMTPASATTWEFEVGDASFTAVLSVSVDAPA